MRLVAWLKQQGLCTHAVAAALEEAAKLVGTRVNTLEEARTYAADTLSLAKQATMESTDGAVQVRASLVRIRKFSN